MKKTLWLSSILFAACATTGSGINPNHTPKEDALATEVVSKDEGVQQCVMMEKARDPGFKTAHARVHIVEGGAVQAVSVLGGRYELSDCVERALKSKSIEVEPNGPTDDYDISL
jgi:hypothetical protein